MKFEENIGVKRQLYGTFQDPTIQGPLPLTLLLTSLTKRQKRKLVARLKNEMKEATK